MKSQVCILYQTFLFESLAIQLENRHSTKQNVKTDRTVFYTLIL